MSLITRSSLIFNPDVVYFANMIYAITFPKQWVVEEQAIFSKFFVV